MKCIQCGTKMTSRRGPYVYDSASGLNVTLLNIEIRECAKCGEEEVVIPNIEELNRTIALEIIRKATRLVPAEVKFLRKFIGFSGADLARHLGVAAETVSRWENGKTTISRIADRAIRMAATIGKQVESYMVLDVLSAIDDTGRAKPLRVSMRPSAKNWNVES